MEIKVFLQKCVDNGIKSITKKGLATKFKLTHYQAYVKLNELRNAGVVSLLDFGKYSYWEIKLPSAYDDVFDDHYIVDEDDYGPEYEPRNAYEQDLADNGCAILHRL